MTNAGAEMNKSSKLLQEGDFAPDFTLDRSGGGQVTLSELRGKKVVVYFYPKDDTPGCTTEAQDFTHYARYFDNNNAVVIGISKDTVEKHDQFCAKYNLDVILGADTTGTVCEAYDVWTEKNNYGKKYMGIERSTFLINTQGVVKKLWRGVKVKGHVEEVLEAVKAC